MSELLGQHSNLYMSVRVAGGMQARNVEQRTFPLDTQGWLKLEWLDMLEAFPNRFVIGSDEIIHQGNSHPSKGSIDATVGLLSQLPDDLRKKIGYENAYTIYKIGR